jgi:hypothetical protein
MPRSSTPARCVYREGNARCRRNGQGNPSLCRAHREVFEHAATAQDSPGATVVGVLRDLFAGKRVSDKRMAAGLFEGIGLGVDAWQAARAARGAPGVPRPAGHPGAWPFGGIPRPNIPPPRPPRPPPPPPGPDPRVALGFPPGARVTVEEVNRRRRELAVKFHPDKPGGSAAKMAEINAAADALLEQIG